MTDLKKGSFDKILAFDCETTGFSFGDNPSKDHQMVSAGLVVADLNFNPIEELYVEINWNGNSKWADQAQQIHGLSKEYLATNGVTEVEATEQIGSLIYDHFGFDNPVTLLGTNVISFDVFFLRKLLHSNNLPIKFSHRGMDTFSLAMPIFGAFTSDELFEILGFHKRETHNALDDAKRSLKVFKIVNNLWDKYVK